VAALRPAVDTLRSGLAIAFAPEGTRSPGAAIGHFKKGAFHVAAAAGAPLVPIVIHDAGRVLPRRAWVMRAGTVHVTVHAPIPTTGWDRRDLAPHVARVEALYRDTLARGPGPPG
jgi:putative phosphoserine phosphatase/1-acylglycerol-3-phosphate O-acyltransferase